MSGNYDGPLGIRFSPLLRHQAGANFARQISVGRDGHRGGGTSFLRPTAILAPRTARLGGLFSR